MIHSISAICDLIMLLHNEAKTRDCHFVFTGIHD